MTNKITLETDLLDRLKKASKFLDSLPTSQPTGDRLPTKDVSRSRFTVNDISVRRKPQEIAKVKVVQPVTDRLEQELTKLLVSYFE
jgi:hypothetical protein